MGDPLSDAVYRKLRDRIAACELVPGQWLSERRSAVEFGLGPSSVRDALARLEQDGLVQAVPPRGYRITPLTTKSVNDLLTTWALVGPEIARLGISHATPKQAAELRLLTAEGRGMLAGQVDPQRIVHFLDLAERTFDLLAIASGNDWLLETYRSLTGEMRRVLTSILGTADSVNVLQAATATWGPTIDHRDGPAAARSAHDFIAASRTAAMLVPSWDMTSHGLVLPLRR